MSVRVNKDIPCSFDMILLVLCGLGLEGCGLDLDLYLESELQKKRSRDDRFISLLCIAQYSIVMYYRLLDYDVCLQRAQDVMEMITERNRLPRDSSLYTKVLLLTAWIIFDYK